MYQSTIGLSKSIIRLFKSVIGEKKCIIRLSKPTNWLDKRAIDVFERIIYSYTSISDPKNASFKCICAFWLWKILSWLVESYFVLLKPSFWQLGLIARANFRGKG